MSGRPISEVIADGFARRAAIGAKLVEGDLAGAVEVAKDTAPELLTQAVDEVVEAPA